MQALDSFFRIWSVIENKYSGNKFSGGVEYSFLDGKFIRSLKLIDGFDYDSDRLGEAVGSLISLVDTGIKTYFANIDVPELALKNIESLYKENADGILV